MRSKKIRLSILAVCLMLGLSACGAKEENSGVDVQDEEKLASAVIVPLHERNMEEILVLGDYRNLKIDQPQPTQEEIDYYSQFYFQRLCSEEFVIKDRAVEVGDAINLDYSGKKEGETEPFEGGTAQNQILTIGSGQFIPGFEDGLVGVMPGETVDLNLTFPEDYHSEELAGAKVVFTCTVNFILPAEITDEIAAGFGLPEVTDVASFKAYIENLMKSYVAEDMEAAVIDALIAQTTYLAIPEDMLENKAAGIRDQLNQYAAQSGTSLEDYVASNYSADAEEFISNQAEEISRIFLTCQEIANRENLTVSDENLEETLSSYATSLGYEDVDTFLTEYANGATREEYREQIMLTNVIDFLTDIINNK